MRNRSVTHSPDAAFHALADPTRRALLSLLRKGRRPAGEIAQAFPVSRPAIAKHLRLLLHARLVRAKTSGRYRFYEIDARPLAAVDEWLADYRPFWTKRLQGLKAFVESDAASNRTRDSSRPRAGHTRTGRRNKLDSKA